MSLDDSKNDGNVPEKPSKNLESWLQLPDTYNDDDEDSPDIEALIDEVEDKVEPGFLEELEVDHEPASESDESTPDEEPATDEVLTIDEVSKADLDTDQTEPAQPDHENDLSVESEKPGLFDDENLIELLASAASTIEQADEEAKNSETSAEVSSELSPDDYEHHFELPAPLPSTGESLSEAEEVTEETPEDTLDKLENALGTEFRDTLTGVNAFTLPLAVIFALLSIVGFSFKLIGETFGLAEQLDSNKFWILTTSGILLLASIHLFIYWAVHRISNVVKSKELDRLIEERRFSNPCLHLDCVDIPLDEEDEVIDDDDSGFEWRCSKFDTSLDGKLICAVCDVYEHERDNAETD